MFHAYNIKLTQNYCLSKGPNFKMRVICANMDATNEAVSPLTYYYGNLVHCALVMKKAWSYNEVLYTSMLEGLR